MGINSAGQRFLTPWALALAGASLLGGCMVGHTPPAAPAPVNAVTVAAPFGRTWDAVIDIFAERNIPIQMLDRSSGLLVAAPTTVSTGTPGDNAYALTLADCGKTGDNLHLPGQAIYNVVVRGDSTSSSVRVNVRFLHFVNLATPGMGVTECSTRGVWELERTVEIRDRAQRAATQR